jgi:putative PEP-CTERM system integral membrane protein
MEGRVSNIIDKLARPRAWAYGLFWSWNAIFCAFLLLGFAPVMLTELIRAGPGVWDSIRAPYLIFAAILIAIPVSAVILGLTALRRSPGRLFTFGYGVEGPLMLAVAIRFFVMREMTAAVALLLSIAGLGMATLLWQLLDHSSEARGTLVTHGRVVGLTLLLLTGLYAAVWVAFYVAPIAVEGWRMVTTAFQFPEWQYALLSILALVLGIYTATLFIVLPVAIPILYGRAWWRGTRALVARHGALRAALLTAVIVVACLALAIAANRQPQHEAFALLASPPASPEQARALQDKEEAIRAGLLNAYLARSRYLSAVGEVRHVNQMYQSLGLSWGRAAKVQRAYEFIARPVLYMPVRPRSVKQGIRDHALIREPARAAALYEAYFDQPLVKGEHETVVRAARSTWSIERAEMGRMAVDDREILLVHQEIAVAEHGDWAEVELYEVYQNQTAQRQEVVYYFSLPESAVITGVWLGNSEDRSARFAYRVSPRGAAQEVYNSEKVRRQDPALVEQIGPRQYRLRVFPVEPQTWRWNEASHRSVVDEGPPLHMWLTWRVLAIDDAWPLPRLAAKRNVYWDGTSSRVVNRTPMARDDASWLPGFVPATAPVERISHRVDLGGRTVAIRPVTDGDIPAMARSLSLAVILDRSRSMAQHEETVRAALVRLERIAGQGGTVDAYLTTTAYQGEAPARLSLGDLYPQEITYHGGQNAAELLVQYDALWAGTAYDAILVLTDGSGYDIETSDLQVPVPKAPVWVVHLDEAYPLGYDDATLAAIQASGGGVAGSVQEALDRLLIWLAGEQEEISTDVLDGYVWSSAPTEAAGQDEDAVPHAVDDAFAAFCARRLILDEMHRQRGTLGDLETLDALHAIAVKHGIVTPYSSMIVLVNERQEQRLDELEGREDRFEREADAQDVFAVTGVPEPEEWLLIALAVAMLAWYARRKGLILRRKGVG